jgi:hypothetical protein
MTLTSSNVHPHCLAIAMSCSKAMRAASVLSLAVAWRRDLLQLLSCGIDDAMGSS